MNKRVGNLLISLFVAVTAGCSGGGNDTAQQNGNAATANGPVPATCTTVACQNKPVFLTVADVQTVIAQAVNEAQSRNLNATIAVVDRVGNVLAVFRMNGADTGILIDSGRGAVDGLEQIDILPDTLAVIAKAVTGAYLSSEGNAFSTRVASQIVQEHFNPKEINQPGGPLFGVQFSQLPCSDLMTRFTGGIAEPGPHRSPLGLSADPGGFPLYKQGRPVGGVGVIADGIYGLDLDISGRDQDVDELIALAASVGYAAPIDRRGDRITVDGKVLQFSDANANDLVSSAANAPSFANINGPVGSLVAVTGYNTATLRSGTAFGQAASGISPATGALGSLDGFFLVDAAGNNRYPAIAGTDGLLTRAEVSRLLQEALKIANRARAQIRRPLGDHARVTISIVDTNGQILGIVRSRDAPIFGTDVSLQKARTAAFFSNAIAGDDLRGAPDAVYLDSGNTSVIGDYVADVKTFLGEPGALDNGAFAFADRSGGNLSRPFYPDGILGGGNGPFSKPIGEWSPFNDGLQLDLVYNAVIQHIVFTLGGGADVGLNCTTLVRMANGMQIFPGSVPIYRNNQLIGGIGVSGDGIEQDDMISFLGLHNAGQALGSINNAPPAIRADRLAPGGVHLRFVQCPQSPFLDSNEQDVCDGK